MPSSIFNTPTRTKSLKKKKKSEGWSPEKNWNLRRGTETSPVKSKVNSMSPHPDSITRTKTMHAKIEPVKMASPTRALKSKSILEPLGKDKK